MTIWYVRRNAGGSIASAHEDMQPGEAEEALDDATNVEIQAYRAAVTAPVVLTPKQKLEATGLTVAELKALVASGK